MSGLAIRRWVSGAVTLLIAAGIAAALLAAYPTLRDAAYASGWTLLGLMLLLTAYSLRKRLPYPPLLSSATWLQLHLYTGLLTLFLFPLHIGLRWPDGGLETMLAAVFLAVAGSGLAGVVLSRAIPRRLSTRGGEVVFERIPAFRRELLEKAEGLAVRSVEEAQTDTLAGFYRLHLAAYFRARRVVGLPWGGSSLPPDRLTEELRSLHRYLNDDERRIARELEELVAAKNSLDYHHTLQGALKLWLFVHVPLTYVLLALVAVHAVLAHTFRGVSP